MLRPATLAWRVAGRTVIRLPSLGRGPMLVPLPVREIMRTPVGTIGPSAPVIEAAQRLRDEDSARSLSRTTAAASVSLRRAISSPSPQPKGIPERVSRRRDGRVAGDGRPRRGHASGRRPTPTNNIKKLPVVEDGSLVGIVTTTDLSDYIPHLSRAVRMSTTGPA